MKWRSGLSCCEILALPDDVDFAGDTNARTTAAGNGRFAGRVPLEAALAFGISAERRQALARFPPSRPIRGVEPQSEYNLLTSAKSRCGIGSGDGRRWRHVYQWTSAPLPTRFWCSVGGAKNIRRCRKSDRDSAMVPRRNLWLYIIVLTQLNAWLSGLKAR